LNFLVIDTGEVMSDPENAFFSMWYPDPDYRCEGNSHCLACRPGGDVLVSSDDFLGFPELTGPSLCPSDWQRLQIGTLENEPVMLVSAPADAPAPDGYTWVNIRPLLGGLNPGNLEALCRASMLASWDYDHRFCGRCGTLTYRDTREAARVCPSCGFRSYPRVSPAMIVRITNGDKILLAHNRRFPEGVYSCVAGYVESGETLEQTVLREIKEEVGLDASFPRYISSQSWPFPHSLMLGFEVEASGTPVPDGEEITDAGWFSPDNLPHIPRHGTIARRLIDGWLEKL
jgi:NAD+ diphosphatase